MSTNLDMINPFSSYGGDDAVVIVETPVTVVLEGPFHPDAATDACAFEFLRTLIADEVSRQIAGFIIVFCTVMLLAFTCASAVRRARSDDASVGPTAMTEVKSAMV